jgi:hypothetical protein
MSGSGLLLCNLSSKPPFRRSQFSENRRRPIGFVWLGMQSEAELRVQIAERETNAFRVFVVSWKRTCAGQSPKQRSSENFKPDSA